MNQENSYCNEDNLTNSQQSNDSMQMNVKTDMQNIIILVENEIVEDNPEEPDYIPALNSDESDTLSSDPESEFEEFPVDDIISEEEYDDSENSESSGEESEEIIEEKNKGNLYQINNSSQEEDELSSSCSTLSLED